MSQNGSEGLLLVRAEPLRLAQEISRTMVDVVRVADGALLLDADPAWARAINTVLVKKGARVSKLRRVSRPQKAGQQRAARRLDRYEEKRADLKFLRVISRTRGGARPA
jgi:hypothetical protein